VKQVEAACPMSALLNRRQPTYYFLTAAVSILVTYLVTRFYSVYYRPRIDKIKWTLGIVYEQRWQPILERHIGGDWEYVYLNKENEDLIRSLAQAETPQVRTREQNYARNQSFARMIQDMVDRGHGSIRGFRSAAEKEKDALESKE
jgi:hypothetical protein